MNSQLYLGLKNIHEISAFINASDLLHSFESPLTISGFPSLTLKVIIEQVQIFEHEKGAILIFVLDIEVWNDSFLPGSVKAKIQLDTKATIISDPSHFLLFDSTLDQIQFLEGGNFNVLGLKIPLKKLISQKIEEMVPQISEIINQEYQLMFHQLFPDFSLSKELSLRLAMMNSLPIKAVIRPSLGILILQNQRTFATFLDAKIDIWPSNQSIKSDHVINEIVLFRNINDFDPIQHYNIGIHLNEQLVMLIFQEMLSEMTFQFGGFNIKMKMASCRINDHHIQFLLSLSGDLKFQLQVKTKLNIDTNDKLNFEDFSAKIPKTEKVNPFIKLGFTLFSGMLKDFIQTQVNQVYHSKLAAYNSSTFTYKLDKFGSMDMELIKNRIEQLDIRDGFIHIDLRGKYHCNLNLIPKSIEHEIVKIKSRLSQILSN